MSHQNPLKRVAFVALVCALFSVAVYAATTFLTVSPTNLQGWQITTNSSNPSATPPSVAFVPGPGTPPLGNGSVELRVGDNGANSAAIRHPGYAGTLLPNPSARPAAAN